MELLSEFITEEVLKIVTDSSNKEQMAMVIRYVNPENSKIREDLLNLLNVLRESLAEL